MATDDGPDLLVDPADFRASEVRLLHSAGQVGEGSGGLLIRGDAGHALMTLSRLDRYRDLTLGKVRLCYIDPPFNTGEDFEHYADSTGTPIWLAALRDRLLQIRELLAPDGSVWVHLDDSEQHRGRCVLDEVFGPQAFVSTIVWQKRTSRDNRRAFSAMHDYIHVYATSGPLAWKKCRNALPDYGTFSNPDNDPRGPWRSVPMSAQAGHATPAQFYTVRAPAGVDHEPPPGRCWTYTRERFESLVAEGRVYWPKNGRGKPRLKRYQSEGDGLAPFTIWTAAEVGDNAGAKKALLAQFPGKSAFDTPKPEALLERIIHVASDPGDLVLDCYLGSGTTAVVAQRMGRRWIGVERSAETVANFALPRLEAELLRSTEVSLTGPPSASDGFELLDVAPSMFAVIEDGIGIADWARTGPLAEATAAQLGYPFTPEGSFSGRIGNRRLAVIDGVVDDSTVRMLLEELSPRDTLELAATEIASSALHEIRRHRGHRLFKIPDGILRSYARRTVLRELLPAVAQLNGTISRELPQPQGLPGS